MVNPPKAMREPFLISLAASTKLHSFSLSWTTDITSL